MRAPAAALLAVRPQDTVLSSAAQKHPSSLRSLQRLDRPRRWGMTSRARESPLSRPHSRWRTSARAASRRPKCLAHSVPEIAASWSQAPGHPIRSSPRIVRLPTRSPQVSRFASKLPCSQVESSLRGYRLAPRRQACPGTGPVRSNAQFTDCPFGVKPSSHSDNGILCHENPQTT
jgi:hypothetical protein